MIPNVFQPIRAQEFKKRIIDTKARAVIKVTTSWSGASRIVSPFLEESASRYAAWIRFFILDYDTDGQIDRYLTVTTFPTLLFFSKGELVEKLSGVFSREVFLKSLESLIKYH